MELTEAELALVREYVGGTPDDDALAAIAEGKTYWQEVALSVLRVRRADAASGEATTSFTLTGVLAVGMKGADLASLNSAIADLEDQIAVINGEDPNTGVSVGRLVRPDRAR